MGKFAHGSVGIPFTKNFVCACTLVICGNEKSQNFSDSTVVLECGIFERKQ